MVCWGDKDYGGDCTAIKSRLVNVNKVFATRDGFAALKNDNSVVTWGASYYNSSLILTDCIEIYANENAFTAIRKSVQTIVVTPGPTNPPVTSAPVIQPVIAPVDPPVDSPTPSITPVVSAVPVRAPTIISVTPVESIDSLDESANTSIIAAVSAGAIVMIFLTLAIRKVTRRKKILHGLPVKNPRKAQIEDAQSAITPEALGGAQFRHHLPVGAVPIDPHTGTEVSVKLSSDSARKAALKNMTGGG